MSKENSPSIRALNNPTQVGEETITAVIRALAILDLLGQSEGELGITEISQRLSLQKSTVFRLLNTLMVGEYVRQNPATKKYYLGTHLLRLGMTVLNQIELRKVAQPYLRELMAVCNEVIHLGILEQNEVIYIDKIDVDRPLSMVSRIGGKSPWYCTGLGKVLLAFSPPAVLEELLSKTKLVQFTPNTITDPARLVEHLKQIQAQGYAIDDEEHELGIRCVGVPIRDYQGSVIAALSVSGPTLRMTQDKLKQIIPVIINTGNRISKALGYMG
ncbi:MAG: IclR family transcriptional regulator [Firmicutes bacterium]|nr:IclR family transcriptional regulator [Bacillota bacterium]